MDEMVFLELLDNYSTDYDDNELYNRFKEILYSCFDGDMYSMFLFPDEEIRAFVFYVAWHSVSQHFDRELSIQPIFSK